MDGFNHVDEVWVASEFTRACLADVAPVPVTTIPLPFVLPDLPTDALSRGRSHFGLPERSTIFLLTFDVSSQTERKNPLGAIRAFRRAAPPKGAPAPGPQFTHPQYQPGARPPAPSKADP